MSLFAALRLLLSTPKGEVCNFSPDKTKQVISLQMCAID